MLILTQLLFWAGILVVAYTFAGYPLHIRWLARNREQVRAHPPTPRLPAVSVIVVVHNEAGRIVERLRNILGAAYPAELMEVVVVSDGSTDGTPERVREQEGGCARVTLVEKGERRGKPAGLNDGVGVAKGEIIVFADARQRFGDETIRILVEAFYDPCIGAVSGELLIEDAASGLGRSVDAYWRLEKMIRRAESRYDSCVGCTGAVYAIRKELYQPIPPDTLLDDVVIPLRIAVAGYRVTFDSAAVAYDPQSLEPSREAIRKRRTLAGNFQMLARYPEWLLPSRNRLWWQLIAHKYLRLLAPFVLIALFILNVFLAGSSFLYALLLSVQIVLLGLALVGLLIPRLRSRVVAWPAGFLFLNLMVVRGLFYFLGRRGRAGW